jgi:hypothetical protein
VAAGEKLGDLRIPVWRLATISGVVTNEYAEPAAGRAVYVMVRNNFGGRGGWHPQSTGVTTDDRGAYTISGLFDGEHLVYLAPSNSPIEKDGHIYSYPLVIYPGGSTLASATPLTLAFGEDRTGVDFRVQLVRAYRVTGTVPGLGSRRVLVRLVSAEEDPTEIEIGIARTTPDGSFSFAAVPAGSYRAGIPLEAPGATSFGFASAGDKDPGFSNRQRQPTLSVPVLVVDEDLPSVRIEVPEKYQVSGSIQFVGATQPDARTVRTGSLVVSTPDAKDIGWARPTDRGDFEFSVPPGKYFLRPISPPDGWSLASITVDGRDAMDAPLDVTNSPISGVRVAFTDKISRVTGSVLAQDGRSFASAAVDGATVFFFPVTQSLWTDFGLFAPRFGRASVKPDGAFVMQGLPAGEYFAVAVPSFDSWTMQQRDKLLELSRAATRIRVGPDDKPVLTLRLIPGR